MTEPAPYLVGSDQLTDGTGLRGFGTDGTPLWAREIRATALARHRDSWLVAGGASRIRRLDRHGAEIWSAEAGGTLRAVAVNLAGTVVAATTGGMAAFDADGAPLWTIESNSDVWGVAIDRDGGIALARVDGRVERRDAGGALIWAVERGAAAIAVALTSAGGVIAAGSADGDGRHLNVYEADGTPRWSASFGTAPYIWAVAVDDRGHVTVGGAPDAGTVARQYTGDGEVVWSSTAGDPGQIRAVSVTPDGTVLTAGAWGSGPKAALLDAGTGTVIWTDDSFERAASTAATPGVRGGGHWRHEAERAAHAGAAATLVATAGKRVAGGGRIITAATVTPMVARRSGEAAALVMGVTGAAAAARTARVVGNLRAAVDLPAAVSRVTRTPATIKTGATLGAVGAAITDEPAEPLIVSADVTVTAGASLDVSAGRIVGGAAGMRTDAGLGGSGHKRSDRTGSIPFTFGIAGQGRPHRGGVVSIVAGGTGRAVATGNRSLAAMLHAGGTGEAIPTATHYGRAPVRIGSHGRAAIRAAKPTPTLLPSSATNEMRALEAVTVRATDLPALHRHNADPGRVRSQLLPWQAWERAVDIWDTTWPDATKRAVSGRAIATHRIRGTPAAVESALASLGVDDAVLTEWFDEEPTGPPYTFRATVTRAGGIERGLSRNLGRAVAASKNTRSHMTRLTLVVPMAATSLHAAPAALAGQAVTVAPIWDPPGPIAGSASQAGAVHTLTAVTVAAHNEAPNNEDSDA